MDSFESEESSEENLEVVLDEEQKCETEENETEESEESSAAETDHEAMLESVRSQSDFLLKENLLLQHVWDAEGCTTDDAAQEETTRLSVARGADRGSSPDVTFTKTTKSTVVHPKLDLQLKFYLAQTWLDDMLKKEESMLKCKNAKLDNVKAKLDETKIEREEIAKEMKEFNEKVRRGARHPVTKKVIAEKVVNYFNASLKRVVIANERLKIKTSDCRAMRQKVLEQIALKEQTLKNLHYLDVRKAKDEHTESVDWRRKYEQQYFDNRSRLNRLLRDCSDLKNALDKEEAEFRALLDQVKKKERSRIVFDQEMALINKEKQDCKALKESIKLDARYERLPAVMDYVYLQAEIVQTRKAVRTWQAKVDIAEAARVACARGRS